MAGRGEREHNSSSGRSGGDCGRGQRNCSAVKPEAVRVNWRGPLVVFCYLFLISEFVVAQQSPAAAAATPSGSSFVDVTQRLGINFQYQSSHSSKKYLLETMGAGVALLDYDNDGRLDIFLVNGAPLADPTAKGTVPQKTD